MEPVAKPKSYQDLLVWQKGLSLVKMVSAIEELQEMLNGLPQKLITHH